MTFSAQAQKCRFNEELRDGVAGKPVLSTGLPARPVVPGRRLPSRLGLTVPLRSACISSTVMLIDSIWSKCYVTKASTLFRCRLISSIRAIRQGALNLYLRTNGQPAIEFSNLQLGLTEKGYSLGRTLRAIENEPLATRRARLSQHFIENLA